MRLNEIHWTDADLEAHRGEISQADALLEGWARWARRFSPGVDWSPVSAIGSVMTPGAGEDQAGARHVAVDCTDDQALLVDGVLARWKVTRPRHFKILCIEYLTFGSAETKGRRCKLKRTDYRAAVDRSLLLFAEAFGAAGREGVKLK